LARVADALRQQLEVVFGQCITFKGEKRESSETSLVAGTAEVQRVSGIAAGGLVGTATGGAVVHSSITAREVDGIAAGVKVDKIGPGPKPICQPRKGIDAPSISNGERLAHRRAAAPSREGVRSADV